MAAKTDFSREILYPVPDDEEPTLIFMPYGEDTAADQPYRLFFPEQFLNGEATYILEKITELRETLVGMEDALRRAEGM